MHNMHIFVITFRTAMNSLIVKTLVVKTVIVKILRPKYKKTLALSFNLDLVDNISNISTHISDIGFISTNVS